MKNSPAPFSVAEGSQGNPYGGGESTLALPFRSGGNLSRKRSRSRGDPPRLTPEHSLQAVLTAGLHVASKLLRHSDIRVTGRTYAPLGIEGPRAVAGKTAKKRLAPSAIVREHSCLQNKTRSTEAMPSQRSPVEIPSSWAYLNFGRTAEGRGALDRESRVPLCGGIAGRKTTSRAICTAREHRSL